MRTALIVLGVLAIGAHAQTPLGTVTGLATDPSGGSVPNASVTLTNQDTGVRRAASTNTSGAYSFPDLAPGVYKLAAGAKGFRSLATPGFAVQAYGTVRQDLKFQIAAESTEVLVAEAARRTPVFWFVKVTEAFGTEPPEGSFASPVTVPSGV